jgi:hypothetical protein
MAGGWFQEQGVPASEVAALLERCPAEATAKQVRAVFFAWYAAQGYRLPERAIDQERRLPWRPSSVAELRRAILSEREHWIGGDSTYQVFAQSIIAWLWNAARLIDGAPPVPPMPAPFPSPSSEPQEGLHALDVLFGWCDQAKAADGAPIPAAPGEPLAVITPPALPDGPVPPDGFRFVRLLHNGLPPRLCKALTACWKERDRRASRASLAENVWGDANDEQNADAQGLHSLRSDLNAFFREENISYHARVKDWYLCIEDGPPTRRCKDRRQCSGRRG